MSRTPLRFATGLAAAMLLTGAGQVLAQTPQAPTNAEARAAIARTDPLSRSVFWAGEAQANPADPVAGVNLAQALREMGRYEQAAAAAQEVLLSQPDNVEAMLEVGRAHIARGQAFYGIAALERARDLAPQDWRPLSLLGVAYQQVDRKDDARAAWNAALILSPDNPAVLANVAMTYLTAGDTASAEVLLRRAAAQPGATLQVRQNLAMVLGLQGKTAEAEQILRRDLPPEVARKNLDWIREQNGGDRASVGGRTWDSLQ
ncbi:tetratricopeptide repeat protein [Brevundimonas vitis]|uniref:Tetratricopeptide repeat protein n=1 Tax=Brevundimonas vitisensis TaxID=2800818 RepID=A0ABX7BUA8_9CAUL|nr:tetratricopeptide repeat protein [Brevundimonas vitisensis]QQQ19876.1 tetratricopeptide repeat protein [Brevundimonas vitisensis]